MEEFSKDIKKRSLLIKIVLCILIIFNIVLYLFQKDASSLEFGLSFQMGICTGLVLMGVIIVYKYESAVKQDEQLMKLYIQEHDERKILIKQKMCQSSLIVIVLCLLIADSLAAYINLVVAYTLTITIFMMLFIILAFKIYYFHKY
ncbi:hypothetical protein [Candidatus Stoquefichus sp. SB1]|jgi:hypothetical protein|uniref:hypothetical protein n=1 Tax=Candidatus Stoquefichus sp. SB1 TaxID=1658109 RepID=UPI00067F7012|nr:hypothetical protein [Candidatus Stoquefichus sp. SB1]